VRTTLTIDEDVAALLQSEIRRSGEPMKQAVNRLLRTGLQEAAKPAKPTRFVVKPIDTGLTAEQWRAWEAKGMSVDDILEEAEGPLS
jgi:hypothetical protein